MYRSIIGLVINNFDERGLHLKVGSSRIGVVTPAQSHCSLRNCHLHSPSMIGCELTSTGREEGMSMHMSSCTSFSPGMARHSSQNKLQFSDDPPSPEATGLPKCIAQESSNLHAN